MGFRDVGGSPAPATADLVTTPGAINGGFYSLATAPESTEPSVVIAVPDVRAALAKITTAGGTVLGEPQSIPEIGLWASFRDSEGNRVSILRAESN